ncbi:MAG: TonB-dependent receptor, partial [Xanthomonadales bacterium]|nr:TonB-dependent receptor [Xanthomonadales bacterium]
SCTPTSTSARSATRRGPSSPTPRRGGQASVDAIDLGSAQRIEVIRGPFSAVYGSASGGVIDIRTEDGPETPFLSGRVNDGTYGHRDLQAKTGGQRGRFNWLASLSSTELDGYRDHSAYRRELLNAKFRYELVGDGRLTLLLNAVDSPRADDPGGLTAAEAQQDRRQAAPRNLLFDAGEALDQQSVGLSLRKPVTAAQELMLRLYHVRRDFVGRLPFGVNSNGQGGSIDLQRRFSGLGGNYRWVLDWAGRRSELMVGFDYDALRDLRQRFANDQGRTGALTTNQDEDVTSTGIYIQDVLNLSDALTLTLGARLDDIEYEVSDRTGGGGSGQRSFSEFNPMLGLNWRRGGSLNLYGNLSRSFDPPATTELANPAGPTGFNENLESQTATNYEVGLKGLLSGRLRYELALFHIAVDDAIVPFELTGSGQAFFENAGSSTHQGLEASLALELTSGLVASAAYTWSDFTFDNFRGLGGEIFDGRRIPGIPEHLFQADLNWDHRSGFYAGWDMLYVGRFYADNVNAVASGDYLVSNLQAGFRRALDGWMLEPFVGVNNLLDERYMGNIRLNAAFGRYYEPAPERHVYAGLELRYGF